MQNFSGAPASTFTLSHMAGTLGWQAKRWRLEIQSRPALPLCPGLPLSIGLQEKEYFQTWGKGMTALRELAIDLNLPVRTQR